MLRKRKSDFNFAAIVPRKGDTQRQRIEKEILRKAYHRLCRSAGRDVRNFYSQDIERHAKRIGLHRSYLAALWPSKFSR